MPREVWSCPFLQNPFNPISVSLGFIVDFSPALSISLCTFSATSNYMASSSNWALSLVCHRVIGTYTIRCSSCFYLSTRVIFSFDMAIFRDGLGCPQPWKSGPPRLQGMAERLAEIKISQAHTWNCCWRRSQAMQSFGRAGQRSGPTDWKGCCSNRYSIVAVRTSHKRSGFHARVVVVRFMMVRSGQDQNRAGLLIFFSSSVKNCQSR